MGLTFEKYFEKLITTVSEKSKDPNTKVGCVIVGEDEEILTTGYNSFPRGINDYVPERYERPEKYYWFEHAERNAIYNAARTGVKLKGATLYCTLFPCMDCSRGIVQVGIKTIVTYRPPADTTQWTESFARSFELFEEANIEIKYFEDMEDV